MRLRLIFAVFVALFALSACGRAGPPIKPSEALAKQAKAEKRPVPEAPTPNKENQDKRFILDGLLD